MKITQIITHADFLLPTPAAKQIIAEFVAKKYEQLREISYELVYNEEDPNADSLKFYDRAGNPLWLPISNKGIPAWTLILESLELAAWTDRDGSYFICTLDEADEAGAFEYVDEKLAA